MLNDEKPKMYLDDAGEEDAVAAVVTAASGAADPVPVPVPTEMGQKLCTMTEVRYLFAQEVRRLRLEHGYEDIYALSNACGRLRLHELMKLEVGLFESFSNIIALARFYDKKVRIVFY